jgi:hypothetical protein
MRLVAQGFTQRPDINYDATYPLGICGLCFDITIIGSYK